MTEPDPAIPSELPRPRLDEAGLAVGATDVLVALVTFAGSLAALLYGLSAVFPIFLASHFAVLVVPAAFLATRAHAGGELTIPVLLLLTTFASGPVGALGCAAMALALWWRRPSAARLQDWYDYIAGVVARSRLTRIYDELASGRLPSDPAAEVPRFGPILQTASIEEQQRVLGVIGRRYHADFRAALRKAMRNKNGFIRAQAAAVASRLSVEEKTRLWSAEKPADRGDPAGRDSH
jgi:hypothetical protein